METKRQTETHKCVQSGIDIEHYTYATGGEADDIQQCYLAGANVELTGDKPHVTGFDVNADKNATRKMISLMVVSVAGKTDNLLQAVLDLPVVDYRALTEKLSQLSGKKEMAATNEE